MAKYIHDHNANPMQMRLHSRKELENIKTLAAKKTTGTRRIKPKRQFEELWKWKDLNPGKKWEDEGLQLIECPIVAYVLCEHVIAVHL